jgi:adenosylhomocysteine nucleosidase
MSKIAIIAAMEREVQSLVKGWKKSALSSSEKRFTSFESPNSIVAIAGIGTQNATIAAKAVVQQFQPSLLISVGLAGALIRSLKIASIFTPNIVVDAASGTEYRCSADSSLISGGVMVTSNEIAGAETKQRLVQQFHALVVDMEAASVAQVAQAAGISFRAVKAISDEAGFVMPPMEKFIDATGTFQSGKFATWVTLRPWHWPRVIALARNSSRASKALCESLASYLARPLPDRGIATLNKAELSEAKH